MHANRVHFEAVGVVVAVHGATAEAVVMDVKGVQGKIQLKILFRRPKPTILSLPAMVQWLCLTGLPRRLGQTCCMRHVLLCVVA
jgi:hypothetical protein